MSIDPKLLDYIESAIQKEVSRRAIAHTKSTHNVNMESISNRLFKSISDRSKYRTRILFCPFCGSQIKGLLRCGDCGEEVPLMS